MAAGQVIYAKHDCIGNIGQLCLQVRTIFTLISKDGGLG